MPPRSTVVATETYGNNPVVAKTKIRLVSLFLSGSLSAHTVRRSFIRVIRVVRVALCLFASLRLSEPNPSNTITNGMALMRSDD